jgi:dTDP-4-dehydrorhamnose 3,5-epimerase
MPYQVTKSSIEGVLVLEPKVFGDARGFFFESYNARDFEAATGFKAEFVQDNHSKSSHGVLRGMHYQEQHAQGKLVRVTQGRVFDVAVDIRKNSSTYGQWFGCELSEENKKQMWIAPGLAHGFLVLSDSAEFLYKTTDYWYPEHERSLRWDDPKVNIAWPLHELRNSPLLAAKDADAPLLQD